jgi:hypothetical protein
VGRTNSITSNRIIDAPRGNSFYVKNKDFYFLPQILGFTYAGSHNPRLSKPLNERIMSWQRRAPKPLLLETVDDSGIYTFSDGDKMLTFDPSKSDEYTPAQLDRFTDAILRRDAKENNPIHGENPILFDEHIYNRKRREIYVNAGTPDDIQGLDDERGIHRGDGQKIFNRTHPSGRKVNSEHQRKKNGASYYR